MNAFAIRLVPSPSARRVLSWVIPIAVVAFAVTVYPYPAPLGIVLNGALVGGRIALIALGISLVYRSNRVINFAAADLGVAPATLMVILVLGFSWNYWLGAAIGLAGAMVLGGVTEMLIIRRFRNAPRLILTVATIGLSQTLLFVAFGIPGWLGGEAERVVEAEGMLRPEWLSGEVARLEVVEHLRAAHGVRGALAEFRVDDAEIAVTFRGPGYSADAFVDRASGRYRLTQSLHGIVAVMNDLHKGRDTGAAWSLVIDVSAGLLVVISLTGLGLLFYLKLRRRPGLAVMLVGGAVLVAVYLWRVP